MAEKRMEVKILGRVIGTASGWGLVDAIKSLDRGP